MNTEEYVPNTTPTSSEKARSWSTGPPNIYSASTVRKTVNEVNIVLLNVD